jgi:hypothetical protein
MNCNNSTSSEIHRLLAALSPPPLAAASQPPLRPVLPAVVDMAALFPHWSDAHDESVLPYL